MQYRLGTASFVARCILMFNAGLRHGEAIGAYRGDPLYHASLDASEYRALLADWGFELIEHAIHDPATGGRIYWLLAQVVTRVRRPAICRGIGGSAGSAPESSEPCNELQSTKLVWVEIRESEECHVQA